MKPPCGKVCPDRFAGCHASCERWAAWETERNAEYKKRLAENITKAYQHEQKLKYERAEARRKRSRKE